MLPTKNGLLFFGLISSQIHSSLKLLAVIVFEISSFLCPNLQRAITKKN